MALGQVPLPIGVLHGDKSHSLECEKSHFRHGEGQRAEQHDHPRAPKVYFFRGGILTSIF